ncbi:hypothetical protein SAMN02745221_00191 [Thermosyntropha lipolytica DSM 11003]|uniref:Uncharacterized protein n=1 Tax=Thermosyntropha lipolytica DSM 11003 TaxID=1123382 RepID=A0A1M5JR02_9FIRM|nr:hypothetical protein [Thermosyntropha lipolytica]SHG42948.1 hypothetical protein SAMN02745221_00191 [Thermosyntropha lipolytica DSM 11003]
MPYWQHSTIYRIGKNSFIIRLLQGSSRRNYYAGSAVYKLSSRLLDAVLLPLYKAGEAILRMYQTSRLLKYAGSLVGLMAFILFTGKAFSTGYFGLKAVFYLSAAFLALILPLAQLRPGSLKGSRLGTLLNWWIKAD